MADALLVAVVGLGRVGRVVCDRGYSSASWRAGIRIAGAEPVVAANRTHPAVAYDRAAYDRAAYDRAAYDRAAYDRAAYDRAAYDRGAYRERHRVEQLWGRLKEWRAVATRYEKTAESYLGALHVAAAVDWIKHGLSHTA